MKYANKKGVPYVILAGDEERQKNLVSLKNFHTGAQEMIHIEDVIAILKGGL
jgi:histidyl-tRNA synthetase